MSSLAQIINPVQPYVEEFHQLFEEILSSKSDLLQQAVEHLSKSSGKMIRPIMTSLMASLHNPNLPKETIRSAVLLELIHTATLIHDDVIDEAKQRRNAPTLNVFFDNRIAVLMGDFVLSSALVEAMSLGNIRVIGIISQAGRDLTEGEIKQFETAEQTKLSEELYFDVIRQKTAILFKGCAEIAGITTNAKEEEIQRLARCGELIGLAFQIRDDIFDYFKEDVGKPTGHDIREGKVTLPLLHTLLTDEGKTEEGRTCLDYLQKKTFCPSEVEYLINFAIERGGISYAEAKIQELLDEARALLEPYPTSEYKTALLSLVSFIATRTK